MKIRTDKTLLVLTALFVGGLAIVAGAISAANMRELATHHDQLGGGGSRTRFRSAWMGWRSWPASTWWRRAGRSTGWIPWIALVVGTVASLAANVAVGGGDERGRRCPTRWFPRWPHHQVGRRGNRVDVLLSLGWHPAGPASVPRQRRRRCRSRTWPAGHPTPRSAGRLSGASLDAGRHVGLGGGLHVLREPVNLRGAPDQRVVRRVGLGRQRLPVLGGRHVHLQFSAAVKHRSGEDLVRAIGQGSGV
jgi:hypothetical protein